jgi:hypothetical protein
MRVELYGTCEEAVSGVLGEKVGEVRHGITSVGKASRSCLDADSGITLKLAAKGS